jgi:hypothetical protein
MVRGSKGNQPGAKPKTKMKTLKTLTMTQAEAREKYPVVLMADGDYTRMLATRGNAAQSLADWQTENPDAYSRDSECVIGESYDATECKHFIDAETGAPITITESN